MQNWKKYSQEIWKIIRQPRYLALSMFVMLVMMIMFAWLPNWGILSKTILSNKVSWSIKLNLAIGLAGSLFTNIDTFNLVLLTIGGWLTGVQTSLMVAQIGEKMKMGKVAGLGIVGMIGSLLGVGCSACGSIILTSVFGVSGAAVIFGYLPFKGVELGIVGIGILLLSIGITAKKLSEVGECQIRQ